MDMNLLGREMDGSHPKDANGKYGYRFSSTDNDYAKLSKNLSSKWFLDINEEEQSLALAPVIHREYDLN